MSDQAQETKVLDEGTAMLNLPRVLSKDSIDDLEYWLTGIMRRLKRNVEKDPKDAVPS